MDGITSAQADARIAPWARAGNAAVFPDAKAPMSIARVADVDVAIANAIVAHDHKASAHAQMLGVRRIEAQQGPHLRLQRDVEALRAEVKELRAAVEGKGC